jgi:opacity protein-like surface antigen
MEKRLIKTLALCAAITPLSAFAGTMGENVNTSGHLYGELGLGYNSFHVSGEDKQFASTWSNDDASFTARAGYEFPLNNGLHLGVEAGYLYLGKVKFNNVLGTNYSFDAKQQGADLLATVTKDLNPNFSVFAKGGVAYIKQSYEVVVANQTLKGAIEDDHGFLPEIAGGVKYNINERLAVTGTVNHIFASSDVTDSTAVGLGLRMTF